MKTFKSFYRKYLTACFALIVFSFLFGNNISRAAAYDTKITLRNGTYQPEQFLNMLQEKSGQKFVYNTRLLEAIKPVKVGASNVMTLKGWLDFGIDRSRMVVTFVGDYVLISSRHSDSTVQALGGTSQKGSVRDSDGEAVVGAFVQVVGTQSFALTDNNGVFEIKLPNGARLLEFSCMGMKTQVQEIVPGRNYRVTLEPEDTSLDEVVVIGYGTQKKIEVTGAVTTVSASDIDRNVGGGLEGGLQGRVPGLNIVSNSGEPGAGSTITLRGGASINGSNEPLYIIDGIPIESGNISSISGDANFSPIAGINPSDIESIQVLRDAASAAIYGSRAANGVVIITTKGGNNLGVTRPRITISHRSSVASLSHRLDLMNSEQFRAAYSDARLNAGLSVDYPYITNPSHPDYKYSTDWQGLMFRPSYQHKTDLSFRGSSDKMSYGLSLSYSDQDPILLGTSYEQYSFRGNFTYRLARRITAGTKVTYSKTDYQRVLSGQSNMSSALRSIVSAPPLFSPYDPETGEVKDMLNGNTFRNPLAAATKYPLTFDTSMLLLSQFFDISIIKGLNLRTTVSLESRGIEQDSYFPRTYDSKHIDVYNYKTEDIKKYLWETTLTYRKKVRKHSFDAVLGASFQRNINKAVTLAGKNFMDESLHVIQNASQWTKVYQSASEYAMNSYFGRANYNFDEKYLVSATLRVDGSSRFGSDSRYGFFPSVSVGWRFSAEEFLKGASSWLTEGKLRLSAGQTGNQSVGNYTWLGEYATSSSRYDGEVAVTNTALSNKTLGWETTTQYNAGLDLAFLRGRISLTADAYIKLTDDLLFSSPLPSHTGFGKRSENFGSISNKGIELALQTINIETADWGWTTNFNISFNKNRIESLSYGEDVIYSTNNVFALARVGEPVGVFYGWRALGVYENDAANVWTDPATGVTRKVYKGSTYGDTFGGGDMRWDDINNDGIINDDDRVIIGNPHPDFIGGFGTSLVYKNFTLDAYFSYSWGNDIINAQKLNRNKMTNISNLETDALSRWRKDGDVTDFPKLVAADPMENFRCSTFSIEDGSYIRLKDISLSYSLPENVCKKLKMKQFDISVNASNLLTWTNYSGYDPEVNTSTQTVITGLDNGAFPKSRVYTLGVKLIF